jgi:tetratricopeptide (TPR) repeat protein
MLEQAILDELWLFDDPAESEARFRVELEQGGPWDDTERAELSTQLARSIGLQGRFDEAAALLIDLEDPAPVVGVRVLLESGRIMNSSGHPDVAVKLFRQAAEAAAHADLPFLEIDAIHMLAIVDSAGAEDWTARAATLAELSPDDRTKRWLVSLHSNLGWFRLEAGDPAAALESFTEAAQWADLVGTDDQRQWAQEAIAECTTVLEDQER